MAPIHSVLSLLLLFAATVLASVPTSLRFDLSKPSYDLYRHKTLHDDTVQQSFVFDNVNRRLFVAQRRNGAADGAGNLCITQLDFSGNQVGYMYINSFGHGVAIGAEAVGSSTYLWTEVDPKSSGYGTRVARFKFSNGATISNSSSSVTKFSPISGATEYTCTTDPVHKRLIVRYQKSGAKHIAVFDLAAAAKGDFSNPLVNFPQPLPTTRGTRFQGYTAYGQYLYLLWGDSYTDSGGVLNSEVASVNMNTGEIKQGPLLTKAGSTLDFREPEGLAIYETAAGQVRLFLGFASGESGDRRSNLFYKNVTIT
ncbi:hypothetical protein jhhlp_005410 [Lomentospora prolificans]|uniref:P68 RBP/TagC-like beta-propeller domain-containing protein n=1 Tax=Lomentospora prolificans TaxID=41688 RepID=A0A2N3N6S3_9PEZI|nr:hypothetical protein jhhlp_005410 [Lomentospora prolificans]